MPPKNLDRATPSHGGHVRKFLQILLASSALCMSNSAAEAQSPTTSQAVKTIGYAIPAGSLGSVISQIGKASNLQILYPSALIRGKQSAGLRGTMTERDALSRVLSGSGLQYRYVNRKTVTITQIAGPSPLSTYDGSEILSTVFVYASDSDNVGKVKLTSEDIDKKFSGDMNALFRAQPGVFTRAPLDQPGLTVNVRGMQGGGRVNSMIDGIPQNFRNVSGHAATNDPLVFIDPLFVQSIDVKKGQARGADGMGTLSGAVNFKTLEASDVLQPNRNFGVLTKIRTNTNYLDIAMMAATAARFSSEKHGSGDILAALSYRKVGAYTDGRGNRIPSDPNINARREPASGLLKLHYSPNDIHDFQFNGQFYNTSFLAYSTYSGGRSGYQWTVERKNASGIYTFTPDNPYVSVRLKAHIGTAKVAYPENIGVFGGRRGTNTAYGFDLTNISSFDLPDDAELTLEYGAALQSDQYKGNGKRGGNPDGSLVKSGVFADASIQWNKFTLDAGLRYDMWQTKGVRSFDRPGTNGCPAGNTPCPRDKDAKSGGKLNPSIGLSYRPIDGLRLYGRYALSSRAPTVSEMFASFHDFSGLGTPTFNNVNLVPEEQKGLDIGFEARRENLFFKGDRFTFGANYFHNTIENYIGVGVNPSMTIRDYLGAVGRAVAARDFAEMMRLQRMAQQVANEQMQFQNAAQTVKMSGIELKGGYDTGHFYINGSAAFMNTKQPYGEAAIGLGNDIGRQPRISGMLDIGTRWFDQKLTIGGRMRYTGKTIQARAAVYDLRGNPPTPTLVDGGHINVPAYALFDVYSSYKHSKNLEIFASVDNVFDKFYRPAGTSSSSGTWNQQSRTSDPIAGKGRTFKFGLNYRF